jgi:hypothetical protein
MHRKEQAAQRAREGGQLDLVERERQERRQRLKEVLAKQRALGHFEASMELGEMEDGEGPASGRGRGGRGGRGGRWEAGRGGRGGGRGGNKRDASAAHGDAPVAKAPRLEEVRRWSSNSASLAILCMGRGFGDRGTLRAASAVCTLPIVLQGCGAVWCVVPTWHRWFRRA